MRKANFFLGLLFVLFFSSCFKDSKQGTSILPASNGKINSISIIIDDVLWNGEIGDVFRKKMAAPVDGLQEEEPLFTINQFSPRIFDSNVKLHRNLIIVRKSVVNEFRHVENQYASPQNVYYISGNSVQEIIATFELHANTLINSIKFYERIENQREFAIASFNDERIRRDFGLTLLMPKNYTYAIANSSFLWLKKDMPSGNSNLVLYSVPKSAIEKDTDYIGNIIRIRDSVGQIYIKGLMDRSPMVTEASYSPYLFVSKINNMNVLETRGTWELQDGYMNGPFINIALFDSRRNRYIIAEGFVYNPSNSKRDLIFELESIIHSIQFID